MSATKAIFIKQMQNIFKTKEFLINFLIFPILALLTTEFIAREDYYMYDDQFLRIFATMFAGMALIITVSLTIAEDREYKSLRFLVMAGVKPHAYLAGIGGAIMVLTIVVSFVFALIGGYEGIELRNFMIAMTLGLIASLVLGAAIGIFSKNQQAATAIASPIALTLAFLPTFAGFIEAVYDNTRFLYTSQINIIMDDLSGNILNPALIILGNIAVLIVLFAVVYKVKGLRG